MKPDLQMLVATLPLVVAAAFLLTGKPTSRRSLYILGAALIYAAGFIAVFHTALTVAGAPAK